jgi:hypothetical protein
VAGRAEHIAELLLQVQEQVFASNMGVDAVQEETVLLQKHEQVEELKIGYLGSVHEKLFLLQKHLQPRLEKSGRDGLVHDFGVKRHAETGVAEHEHVVLLKNGVLPPQDFEVKEHVQEHVAALNVGSARSRQGLLSQTQLQVFGLKIGAAAVQLETVLLHLHEQVAASNVEVFGDKAQMEADLSHSHLQVT